jgi:hypothetical protein
MLASSARISPCIAFARFMSLSRSTRSSPASISMLQ